MSRKFKRHLFSLQRIEVGLLRSAHKLPVCGRRSLQECLYACRVRAGDHWSGRSSGATGASSTDGKAGPGHDRQGVQQLLVRRGEGRLVALPDGNAIGGVLAKARRIPANAAKLSDENSDRPDVGKPGGKCVYERLKTCGLWQNLHDVVFVRSPRRRTRNL
jgi:hypothetical protein